LPYLQKETAILLNVAKVRRYILTDILIFVAVWQYM